jgi:hypothetical protein
MSRVDMGTPFDRSHNARKQFNRTEENAEEILNAIQNLQNAIERTNPKREAGMPKFVSHVARRHA